MEMHKKLGLFLLLTSIVSFYGAVEGRDVPFINLTNQTVHVGVICDHCSNDVRVDVGPFTHYVIQHATGDSYHVDIDGLKRPNKFGLVTKESADIGRLVGTNAPSDAFVLNQVNKEDGTFDRFEIKNIYGGVFQSGR